MMRFVVCQEGHDCRLPGVSAFISTIDWLKDVTPISRVITGESRVPLFADKYSQGFGLPELQFPVPCLENRHAADGQFHFPGNAVQPAHQSLTGTQFAIDDDGRVTELIDGESCIWLKLK